MYVSAYLVVVFNSPWMSNMSVWRRMRRDDDGMHCCIKERMNFTLFSGTGGSLRQVS